MAYLVNVEIRTISFLVGQKNVTLPVYKVWTFSIIKSPLFQGLQYSPKKIASWQENIWFHKNSPKGRDVNDHKCPSIIKLQSNCFGIETKQRVQNWLCSDRKTNWNVYGGNVFLYKSNKSQWSVYFFRSKQKIKQIKLKFQLFW